MAASLFAASPLPAQTSVPSPPASPAAGPVGTMPGTASGTAPGTVIDNVAAARWTAATVALAARSNTDRLVVAERLDVALSAAPAGPDGVPLTLVNQGTGSEAFVLAATLSPASGEAVPLAVAVDADGDGRVQPADQLPSDGRTPVLAPGAILHLVAVLPPDASGTVAAEAHAQTGSGTPGTVFPGAGDGGSDAVIGPSGAVAPAMVALDMPTAPAGPALAKSQAVRAPDGSARAVAGAIVTYSLAARLDGIAGDAVVEDAIPAGTRYLPGSLTLDDAPLSDAPGDDAGGADGTRITVRLTPSPAPHAAARTIRFAVQIL